MKLERKGVKTVLDGAGTLLVSKNEVGLRIDGFGDNLVEISNQHIVMGSLGKRKQLNSVFKWIYSKEIKTAKKVAFHSSGGLIGAGIGVLATYLLAKRP